MDPGSASEATLYYVGLAGWVVMAIGLLAYAGHCLVVVFTETSLGIDEVRWPAESPLEWYPQIVHLFALIIALLAPIYIIARLVGPGFISSELSLRTLALGVPWLWFIFPVALLSSLSGIAPWMLFRPLICKELFRIFPSTFFFYSVTGLGLLGLAGLWIKAILGSWLILIPIASLASAGAILVYARLLGRMGWLIGQLEEKKPKPPVGKLQPKERKKIEVVDPWADTNSVDAVTKYRHVEAPESPVAEERKRRPRAAGTEKGSQRGGDSPLIKTKAPATSAYSPPAPSKKKATHDIIGFADEDEAEEIGQRRREEVENLEVEKRPARITYEESRPDWPMLSGIFNFPLYVTSLRAFFLLTLGLLILGYALERLAALAPMNTPH